MLSSVQNMTLVLKTFELDQTKLTLTEITKETKLPKSTVFKLLNTLTHCGFLIKDEKQKKYSPSIRLFEMGQLYLNQLNLIQEATPFIEFLVKRTGLIVLLSQYEKGKVTWVFKSSSNSFTVYQKVGKSTSVFRTASGKSILAYMKESEVSKAYENLNDSTKEEIEINYSNLLEELKIIKKSGYAVELEEMEEGISLVSAPIFDYTNIPFASISITGSSSKFGPGAIKFHSRILKETSHNISECFGYNKNFK